MRMIGLEIPGFGHLEIHQVISDFTGTHAFRGKIRKGVKNRLIRLAGFVEIHILTADTRGTAKSELAGMPIIRKTLKRGKPHDEQKAAYVNKYDPRHVAAFGNGLNDRLMLKIVKDAGGLAVAVDNGEGCAIETMQNANLFVYRSENALDLLLDPNRCKATLRTH
jgi:soluble P-type ATPase